MGRLFGREWHDLCLLHSRFYARRLGRPFSRLCVADKLAIALTPTWLYLPMVRLAECRSAVHRRRQAGLPIDLPRQPNSHGRRGLAAMQRI